MKNGSTLIEVTVCIFMFLVLVAVVLLSFTIRFSSRGNGTHTGVVTAVDRVGYIFPNYQVFFKTDSGSSQEDVYCVHRDNKELAEKLKTAAKNKTKVTLEYKGVRGIGLGLCDGEEIYNISD